MQVSEYGTSEPMVIVLHGGPGVSGYMAPVARALAEDFRVLEPRQRGSGDVPLTVERHVADLHELIESRCSGIRPALVGHSWGAMLALAYASAHPDYAAALALIGCGTFDPAARSHMQAVLEGRMDESLKRRLRRRPAEFPDPDRRLRVMGKLILPYYSYDLVPSAEGEATCDACAQRETWEDMLRLQREGVYPAAFAAIKVPLIMLHGAADPHPGRMIRAGLSAYLPQLEYREWECCGHYPWLEKNVREEFLAVLREWLKMRLSEQAASCPRQDHSYQVLERRGSHE